jgi:hypothetical protein
MIVECIKDTWYDSIGRKCTKNCPIKGQLYEVTSEVKDSDSDFLELQEFGDDLWIKRCFREVTVDISEIEEIISVKTEILV